MNREHLDQILAEWKAQDEAHRTRSIRCCSACTLGDARVPLLLAEIDRLNARVEALKEIHAAAVGVIANQKEGP